MDLLDPEIPRQLSRPAAHPRDPSAAGGVRAVQTHISHVFLTADRVYKVRKAVDLSFVDFSSRSARNADCLRELALNRRLAPDVYLGVAPLVPTPAGFQVGPLGEALAAPAPGAMPFEHCVVMRRLAEGRDGLSLLESGKLTAAHLDAVAAVLARFHASHGLGRPAPYPSRVWRERIEAPVRECFAVLRQAPLSELEPGAIERAEVLARRRFEEDAQRFEARRQAGRAVDGHGDVHLQHVWFEADDAPLLIDCLEFNDELRRIDAASEVAFLAMDLAYRRRRELAERFLRDYAMRTDDFDLYGVVDYFAAYRALVRAKVAALAVEDQAIQAAQRAGALGSVRRHLDLACRLLERRSGPSLVLLCGWVGSGKSTVAAALADRVPGVVISSDRTRKRLFGLAATERAPERLYRSAISDRVYAGLLERAEPVLHSGRVAILDATFARADRRKRALEWAEQRGATAWLVETRCGEAVTLKRLARRKAKGRDPSDAGPSLYAWSVQHFEAPEEWPQERRAVVATDGAAWEEQIDGLAKSLR